MSVASRPLWMTANEKYSIVGLCADLNSSRLAGFQHVLHMLIHMGCVNCGERWSGAILISLTHDTSTGFDDACRSS